MLVKAIEQERAEVYDSGKQEGIGIGKQEGIAERNRQIAQAMVADGFPVVTIANLLDLSVTVVEQLLSPDDTSSNSE